MNKRLISKIMHQRVAGLGSSSIYFFRGDYGYILQGVALEYVPRGLYIWDFKSPLFDFYGLSLSYSSRLPERGFIANGEMTEAEIVDHVMSSPAAQANLGSDNPMSLSEFVQFLEAGYLRSSHARLIHAAALVLLGEGDGVDDLLAALPPLLHPIDIEPCRELRSSLAKGQDVAQALLEQIRHANLKRLALA